MAPQKVTIREAYKTFLTLLAVNHYSVVPDGKFTIIEKEKYIPGLRIPIYKGTDAPDRFQMVASILKFKHVSANDMSKVLKIFGDKGGIQQVFDDSTLILVDYAANIRKMKTVIDQLDQPSEADSAKLYFLKLKYVDASDAKKIIDDIFKDFKKKSRRSKKRRGSNDNTPQITGIGGKKRLPPKKNSKATTTEEEGIDGEDMYLHIVEDERSEQLIVLCTKQIYTLIMQIIQNIDKEVEGEGEIHVVKLQNAKAEDLVKTLNTLSKNNRSRGKGKNKGADVFEGEVQISANESTNSLVIVSSLKDYRNLKKVVEKLDIRRKQVFVEAAILEVNVDDSLEYGNAYTAGGFEVDIAGETIPLFFGKSLDANMTPGVVAGMVGPAISGTEGLPGLGLTGGIPSLGVILNAAQSDSAVNVMSTPHLLTTDNEEAEITVGETIPFPSGNIISGTAGSTVTYTREDVALKLKIKPQINESGYMTLEVNQEVTELGAQTQYGFRTTKRQAKTIINAENEQTIVIGGLMKDYITESENKVPILGDIPVLGALFKYKRTTKKKVNLLIILTPHVIESKEDFNRILKRKIKEREEFEKKFYSGRKSFEESIYLEKKRGPLMALLKKVNEENRNEKEELLRLEANKINHEPVIITPDGRVEKKELEDMEKVPDINEGDDAYLEDLSEREGELVPELDGE
jgi:general secretion pathway protein D